MEPSARLYNCACCHRLVVLCSHCDHGHIYCFDGCSETQRSQSLREAGRRYQSTFEGKRNAARRQAEFRERTRNTANEASALEEKVTHQGSGEGSPPAPIEGDSREGGKTVIYCHCCGKPVDCFLRSGPIRYTSPPLLDTLPFQSW